MSPTRAQRPTEIGTPRPTRLPASHPRHGPETAPAAQRYWNRGRQRYCRSLVRYCPTLRVSADRAANRAAHTRGKPRLLDVGRRIPTRDGFAPDSPLEGNGFERSVPRLDSQRFSWVRPSWGQSTGAPVIRAVAGFGTPTELSSGGPRSRHSLPGSGGVTTAALSPVPAHRGTESSNPFPSSRQSVSRGISPSRIEKPAVAGGCGSGQAARPAETRRGSSTSHLRPTG